VIGHCCWHQAPRQASQQLLISRIVLNEETLFLFRSRQAFNYKNIPYYLILAVLCGFYARYFLLVTHWVEHKLKALKVTRLQKALAGGLVLSLLCCLFPPLFGEGYQTVKDLVNGKVQTIISLSFFKYFPFQSWFIIIFLGLICLFKAFASSITIFSGGNGGNFAPSLFAGGVLGYFMATLASLLGVPHVPVNNMVIVGMAGVMSGVLYAPLTAIFLIAESSSGYDLFIPLMIVSVMSFLMAKRFSAIAPDLKALADSGQIFTTEHDRNLLSLMHAPELIDRDFQTINTGGSFKELIDLIKVGKRSMIAVIDPDGHLAGIITLENIRPFMFDHTLYDSLSLQQVMSQPPALIGQADDMGEIIKKFDETGSWNLPVIYEGAFVGFISKSSILNSYRQLLKAYS
jgi:CIC family chloride channel protein